MKRIITVFITPCLLYACQKAPDYPVTEPVSPASNCRLTRITQGLHNNPLIDDTSILLSYDQKGKITAVGDSIGMGFTIDKPVYDASGHLISITGEQSRQFPVHLEYNSRGLLTAITDSSVFSTYQYVYEYGPNNLPVKRTLTVTDYDPAYTPSITYKNYFYNTAGDIIRTLEYYPDSTSSAWVTEYTYTNDVNTFTGLTPYYLDALYGFGDIMSTDFYFNKKMAASYTSYDKFTHAQEGSTVNTYTRDSLNRITIIISNTTYVGSNVNNSLHTRKFFYDCN